MWAVIVFITFTEKTLTVALSFSFHETLKNVSRFFCTHGSRCHDNGDETISVRHHLRSLTSGGWHSSVTRSGAADEDSVGGLGGDSGEIQGDGTGRERVEVKDGELAHWPSGPRRRPNNGCQHCTQVKLKWLQCEGKEYDPSGGQECTMQEGHSHASQDLFRTLTDRVAVWLTIFGKMEINENRYHFNVIHTSADQWAASLTNSGHPVVT